MAKYLLTGGLGFVGSNLARYFHDKGHEVHVADNLVRRGVENNLPEFKKKGIKFFHCDIRAQEDFLQFDKHYDAVLECSAQCSATDGYANPRYDFTINTEGLFNVLEFCRHTDSPLIFWSSNKALCGEKINALERTEDKTRYVWTKPELVINNSKQLTDEETAKITEMLRSPKWGTNITYGDSADLQYVSSIKGFDPIYGISEEFNPDGNQHSIYGASKLAAETFVREYYDAYGLPTVVNRFSCMAGPHQFGKCSQGWNSWFVIANILELPIQYIGFDGKQVRDVAFIPDICRLIELEIENIDKIGGQVFMGGGGKDITTSLIEHTARIEAITGIPMQTSYNPEVRKADHALYISDIRKARDVLGWEPKVGLEEGTEQIIKWVHDNRTILEGLYL